LISFNHQTIAPLTEDHIYEDRHLFALIAEGDEEAFATLFNKYIEVLKPFSFSITKNETAAEEMVQETFIRIWLNRDKLAEIENPHSWIFTIASRESIGYLRKKLLDDKLKQNVAKVSEAAPDVVTEAIKLKELKELVHKAVEELSPQRKRIFKMSRNEGMKIAEIAAALDIAPSTVKNILVTSTKQIREYLNARGHMLGALLVLLFPK
jgi:RNA polymerase sigma-70 factor (family 1)